MKFQELSPSSLSSKLIELLKKQPPAAPSMQQPSSFGGIQSSQQQTPPLLAFISISSEILQLISVALNNNTYKQEMHKHLSTVKFEQSFPFLTLKSIATQQTLEKQQIEVLTSKYLVFLVELIIWCEASVVEFQSTLLNFLNQAQNLNQNSTLNFCKCIAISSVQKINPALTKFLISVPVLEFSHSTNRNEIMNSIQNQQLIVHFSKIKQEFFKRFQSLKDQNQIQKTKIQQVVQCPFGEYERENNTDESAKKMKIQPQVYVQMVDGINNILMTIRQEVCNQFSDKAIQINFSQYNLDWLDTQEFDLEMQIFYLVQVINNLRMIKNDYYINSYQDSIIDESPYEILYAKQYEVNEQFIRTVTDILLKLVVQIDHSSEKLNKYYENIIYSIIDSNNFDKNTNIVKRNGQNINLDTQLLSIIKVVQTIQDMKLFLTSTLSSIDFTTQYSSNQTVLQLILQQSVNTYDFNDAFGLDILQLLSIAQNHNIEQTRSFMSNSRTLKLQTIESYIQNLQQNYFNFHNQFQGKIYEQMNTLYKNISTGNKEICLVDTILGEQTPAQVFKGLTDILTKVVYDSPLNNVTLTFDNAFDQVYLAYLSNPKYFITRALIQINTFINQVSNATIEEILITNSVHLYNYSNSQKLEQIIIQAHILWLEILCSPVIDFTIIEQFISIANRFKEVANNNYQQQLFVYRQIFNKFQMLMVNNKITATALLSIFTDLDQLFYQPSMQQFYSNFLKIFNYDLDNAFNVLKVINDTSYQYYNQLYIYLQQITSKSQNIEIIFNILKNNATPSIQQFLSIQIANCFNLLQKQDLEPLLSQNILKFVITIMTNYKMNPFAQFDSQIIYDVFQSIFDGSLEFAYQILFNIQNDMTIYLLSFFFIVLLEQFIEIDFNSNTIVYAYQLITMAFKQIIQKPFKASLVYDLEQKFVLILHKIKKNIKTQKYEKANQEEFNTTIQTVSEVINKQISPLALLSQLFEIKMLCFYHYSETVNLQFANLQNIDGEEYQSNIQLLTSSVSASIGNSLLSGQYQFSQDILLQIIFLLNITNFCCNVDIQSHPLYYAVLKPFDNSLLSFIAPDEYVKLLLNRISQLRDKVSLSGSDNSQEIDFFYFISQIQQALNQDKISDTDLLLLQNLYDTVLKQHIEFNSSDKLFSCNKDLLGISCLLINKLFSQSDKSIFITTLHGLLTEKVLSYIYLNFYGTKQNQLKININVARSVIQIDNEIYEVFQNSDNLMKRISLQLARIHNEE
ncbi:hypothetical protein SS50377_20944 [Spironucleus salmonicida]|uniref:Uncharacterized protein n=1 Tax=Spironucleus salmonicida TaxID=348837 RepID=V6LGG4_9EUKA|nr:hypothetical protein SS50377_20944 [Spironucleus salmonicida]|eukprot:EST43617.1 Hypothetical protein SS50377_16659 [Spironucleus salmonicida]